jgi:hypothetical protein
VIWQSVIRQYLEAAEREAIEASIRRAAATIRLAWLALEPGGGADGFDLRCWEAPLEEPLLLATGWHHGPPVRWSVAPA